MKISCGFDSGSIEFVGVRDAGGESLIDLRIRADGIVAGESEFRQWFHFRLQGARGLRCRLRLANAAACTYPQGWEDYRALASYDRRHWFRVRDTRYEGGELTIAFTPDRDSVHFAYFEPYSLERHLDLLGRAEDSPLTRVSDLGDTVEGRDLNLITVGEPAPHRRNVWLIARQHPGEPMAEWFVEGLLERVLDRADPVARRLLQLACLHVVPNMNPDGTVRGNLRCNAAGANLNREWQAPSAQRSPEVLWVRRRMHETGVDLFLDIHGDETLPYVFTDGCGMLPGFSAAQAARERRFADAFLRASPDFQSRRGYAADRFGAEMLTLASKYVGHAFGCLSLTLEMPFKDNADLPDEDAGWSGERSRRLGAAALLPILEDLQSTPD